MKLSEALEITTGKRSTKGYFVHFDRYDPPAKMSFASRPGPLRRTTDSFPDADEEPGLKLEEAVKLAQKFADTAGERFRNIHIRDASGNHAMESTIYEGGKDAGPDNL